MKCKYCGYNLGLEDRYCPHCGRENDQAARHLADMQHYQEDYEKTKEAVITKSARINGRTARLIIVAILILIVAVMLILIRNYVDFDTRHNSHNRKVEKEVEKNREDIAATLKEMEEHRDYLAMSYYITNHQLRSNDAFQDYSRVYTAVISYRAIYTDILNIVDGFDGYTEQTAGDWCDEIAIYITDWNSYVSGEFWNDSADSPMHAGAHGAFLTDIKKDTQDMVQVYFKLSDEQAASMWTMEKDEVAAMLRAKCSELYPGENAGE